MLKWHQSKEVFFVWLSNLFSWQEASRDEQSEPEPLLFKLFVGPLIPLFWTSCDVCPGFQSQGGSVAWMLSHLCDPQIHLWCNACLLYRGEHDSRAFSIHVLADRVSHGHDKMVMLWLCYQRFLLLLSFYGHFIGRSPPSEEPHFLKLLGHLPVNLTVRGHSQSVIEALHWEVVHVTAIYHILYTIQQLMYTANCPVIYIWQNYEITKTDQA